MRGWNQWIFVLILDLNRLFYLLCISCSLTLESSSLVCNELDLLQLKYDVLFPVTGFKSVHASEELHLSSFQ